MPAKGLLAPHTIVCVRALDAMASVTPTLNAKASGGVGCGAPKTPAPVSGTLKPGARVKARYMASSVGPEKATKWFEGTVTSVNQDGTCNILYDDDGDEEEDVEPEYIQFLSENVKKVADAASEEIEKVAAAPQVKKVPAASVEVKKVQAAAESTSSQESPGGRARRARPVVDYAKQEKELDDMDLSGDDNDDEEDDVPPKKAASGASKAAGAASRPKRAGSKKKVESDSDDGSASFEESDSDDEDAEDGSAAVDDSDDDFKEPVKKRARKPPAKPPAKTPAAPKKAAAAARKGAGVPKAALKKTKASAPDDDDDDDDEDGGDDDEGDAAGERDQDRAGKDSQDSSAAFDAAAASKSKAAADQSAKRQATWTAKSSAGPPLMGKTPGAEQATWTASDTSRNLSSRSMSEEQSDELPVITEPVDMFRDMVRNAELKAQLKGSALDGLSLKRLAMDLQGRPIRVATMCSGTESPLLALDLICKAVHEQHGTPINVEHVFSCEIEPFKQACDPKRPSDCTDCLPHHVFSCEIEPFKQVQDGTLLMTSR